MKVSKSVTEKGQVLLLLAVGLVVFLGFVALALDGGAIFFDRRSAQNAADAAALAAAYEKANNATDLPIPLATRMANAVAARTSANNYGTVNGKIVEWANPIPTPDNINYVGGDTNRANYVRVRITSTVNTSFLHFVFPGPVKNTVEAIAHVWPPQWGNPWAGAGLVVLAPTEKNALTVNGGTYANLMGGGIFVNSNSTGWNNNAADGGDANTFIYTPTMNVVGTIGPSLLGSRLVIGSGAPNSPAPSRAISYPPLLPSPVVPDCAHMPAAAKVGTTTHDIGDGVLLPYDIYNPGVFTKFPPSNKNVWLNPGIYCISDPNVQVGVNLYNDQSAGGVLLYFYGTNPCNVTINNTATVQLSSYTADPYKGLLWYVDPGTWKPATTGVSDNTTTFNGSAFAYVIGTIYAPTCSLKLNGTGGNMYQGQVIGYDVKLAGTMSLNMNYISDLNYKPELPGKVDLNQ